MLCITIVHRLSVTRVEWCSWLVSRWFSGKIQFLCWNFLKIVSFCPWISIFCVFLCTLSLKRKWPVLSVLCTWVFIPRYRKTCLFVPRLKMRVRDVPSYRMAINFENGWQQAEQDLKHESAEWIFSLFSHRLLEFSSKPRFFCVFDQTSLTSPKPRQKNKPS